MQGIEVRAIHGGVSGSKGGAMKGLHGVEVGRYAEGLTGSGLGWCNGEVAGGRNRVVQMYMEARAGLKRMEKSGT